MDLKGILKTFSFLIKVLIIFNMFSPVVKSLPFLDEIKSKILNNDDLKLLHKQFERPLGFFSGELINLQKTEGFILEEAEQTVKSIYDRLHKLFILPFNHPIIQKTNNESEIHKGDCLAPDYCFTKKQGINLCTVCEEDMAAATELIDFFQEAKNASELVDMGEKCKHVLNEYLFNYALTSILITKFPDFEYPSIIEVFPELFLKKDELENINNKMVLKHRHKRMTDTSDPILVEVRPAFDSKNMAYFTEDYGYNSNHWNWHIIHRPYSRIDRRGELFWYMHHQMLARYDIERLSLGLNRVESTGPLNRTLKFGYFPNLNASENGREWASRQDNMFPTSIKENGRVALDKDDLILWHARLSEAARDGFMLNENNEPVLLSDDTDVNNGEKRGIDIFTGASEADPVLTPNFDYYGYLHNQGHRIISRLHDPESENQQAFSLGVMASAAVSARDPSFYEWHKYVEEVMQDYKTTQTSYTEQRLQLANVYLSDVQIAVDAESLSTYKQHISENMDSKILEDAEITDNETEIESKILEDAERTDNETEIESKILEDAEITDNETEILIETKILEDAERTDNETEIESKILEDAERTDNETVSRKKRNENENVLLTGCNTYRVDISRGVDFGHRRSEVIIEFTHLDHIPFYYNIYVLNAWYVSKNITVRIFLAPMFDSHGQRMQLHEQQHLIIILDKFRYILSPGENVIHRLSTESSITSNCRHSRRDSERESFSRSGVFGGGHCGCGWPHHLLIPRGKHDGMMFQIFVMLTDGDEDYVHFEGKIRDTCGTSGERYPDWQPMGYPFDRPFHPDIYYLDQLAGYLTNAHVSNVSIQFTGRNILTGEFTC